MPGAPAAVLDRDCRFLLGIAVWIRVGRFSPVRDGSIVTEAAAAGGFRTVRVRKRNGARTALAANRGAALRGIGLRRIDPRRTIAAIGLRMSRPKYPSLR